ncbi:hypothetical protein G7Y79_00004g015470 [Physcia stellaris]|nr:hypothetical protein G7Y79_00004g015470 [Physcia stellaris]
MDLPICCACGNQYDNSSGTPPAKCKICDDPRQYVPPTGQNWTTLEELDKQHRNVWEQDKEDSRVWSLWTEPKFAIGQRAFLLETENGSVMWDLVSLLDDDTVGFVSFDKFFVNSPFNPSARVFPTKTKDEDMLG